MMSSENRTCFSDVSTGLTMYEYVALVNCKFPLSADHARKNKKQQQQHRPTAAAVPVVPDGAGGGDGVPEQQQQQQEAIVVSESDDDDGAALQHDQQDDDAQQPPRPEPDRVAAAADQLTLRFGHGYPSHETHAMRVFEKMVVPRIAGQVLNKLAWRCPIARYDEVAQYLGVLFCPWNDKFPPVVRNFDTLMEWYAGLDLTMPRQAFFHSAVTTILTYNSNRYTKQMLNSYRMRHADSKYKRELHFVHSAKRACEEAGDFDAVTDDVKEQLDKMDVLAACSATERRTAEHSDDPVVVGFLGGMRRFDVLGAQLSMTLATITPPEIDRAVNNIRQSPLLAQPFLQ
jgi:hypothetical protein